MEDAGVYNVQLRAERHSTVFSRLSTKALLRRGTYEVGTYLPPIHSDKKGRTSLVADTHGSMIQKCTCMENRKRLSVDVFSQRGPILAGLQRKKQIVCACSPPTPMKHSAPPFSCDVYAMLLNIEKRSCKKIFLLRLVFGERTDFRDLRSTVLKTSLLCRFSLWNGDETQLSLSLTYTHLERIRREIDGIYEQRRCHP